MSLQRAQLPGTGHWNLRGWCAPHTHGLDRAWIFDFRFQNSGPLSDTVPVTFLKVKKHLSKQSPVHLLYLTRWK